MQQVFQTVLHLTASNRTILPMQNHSVYHLILFGLIAALFSSCDVSSHADFELAMDPVVPGRVNVINKSERANSYEWTVATASSEFGTFGTSSTYPNSGYYDGEVSRFYIQENEWVEVTLRTLNGFSESIHVEKIHVTNIPSILIIGDLVVTRVNLSDIDGYEWDDADGSPLDGVYDSPSEYPDLLINNSPWAQQYSDNNVVWDVDIENGLPQSLTTDQAIIDNLGPQADEYYVQLVDFDGTAGSMFLEAGTRIGTVIVKPWYLTHKQDNGSDENYPAVYKIVHENFEADLHMTWQ